MKLTALLLAILTTQMMIAQETSPQAGPESRRIHQQRGDQYVKEGDIASAIAEYGLASEAVNHRDTGLLKKVATLNQWTRHFTQAKEWLGMAVSTNPADAEATEDLSRLQSQRGLQFSGTYGGGEIDYTNRTYNINGFYGGVDWLDLHAGYSMSDKLVYSRSTTWIDAYIFPHHSTYVRFGVQRKQYVYPRSVTASPDDNAYSLVPDYQIELGHYYYKENYLALELEYFTPNFFWNQNLKAHNLKIGGTVRNWVVRPLYVKFFASMLRDPDPQSFLLNPATKTAIGFGYEHITLIGAAVGLDNDRWNVELKYVPDRDLDRSLDWSLFGKIRFNAARFGVQYDFLFDQYPQSSSRSFQSSQVHMATLMVEPTMFLDLKAGIKVLRREVTTLNPFVSIHIKTGV